MIFSAHPQVPLVTHPYLGSLGLCFNRFLGLVICIECSCGIGRKGVAYHLHEVHRDEQIRLNNEKLGQAFIELGVNNTFDLACLSDNCLQIEGLHLTQDTYICSHCKRIRGNLASIKEHHFLDHKNLPIPSSWKHVVAQKIHHQNRTPYFKVIPRLSGVQMGTVTQHYLCLQNEREKKVVVYAMSKVDPRQVSMQQSGMFLSALMTTSTFCPWSKCPAKLKLNWKYWQKQ